MPYKLSGPDDDSADLPPITWIRWATLAALLLTAAGAWTVVFTTRPFDRNAIPTDLATTALYLTAITVVPIGLLVWSAYAYWRFRLERHAYNPGPIRVLPFKDRSAGPGEESAEARRLRAAFESRLAKSKVYASTAIPSPAHSNDFLHVVERAGDSAPGTFGAASRMLRLLAPGYAYSVECEIIDPESDRRPGGGDGVAAAGYGIIVELNRLPKYSVAPITIRDPDRDRLIERAANHVAELILPRTPQCATPPWTTWRGLQIPTGLFDLYHVFQRQKRERCFDDATVTVTKAIELDPGNLALRLELGKLQEQMQMYLDALLTYDDIITLASRKSGELSSWWNMGESRSLDDPEASWADSSRARGLSSRHPVVEVARYRHALLLGLGYELADQWWNRREKCRDGQHRTRRESHREYLRTVLAQRFTARYPPLVGEYMPSELRQLLPYCIHPRIRDVRDESDRIERAVRLRVVLTLFAVYEVKRLLDEVGVTRGVRSRGSREVLPERSLQLIAPWSILRHTMAVSVANRVLLPEDTPDVEDHEYKRRLWQISLGNDCRDLVDTGWPARFSDVHRRGRAIAGVRTTVEGLVGRQSPARVRWLMDVMQIRRRRVLRSWHEHYNAACVYSLLLAPDSPDDPGLVGPDNPALRTATTDRDMAARAAIAELRKAVSSVGSGHLTEPQNWILTNDPDFDQLRGREEFRDFEALVFGSVSRAAQRGPRLVRWEQGASVTLGIREAARRMASLWERRLKRPASSKDTMLRWLDDEATAWGLAEAIAVDHRDWSRRSELRARIREVPGWSELADGRSQVTYSDIELAVQIASMTGTERGSTGPDTLPVPASIEAAVSYAIHQSNDRLLGMAEALRASDDRACCPRAGNTVLDAENRSIGVTIRSRHVGEPSTVALFEQWCRQSHRRWVALASWFDDRSLGQPTVTDRGIAFYTSLRSFVVVEPGGAAAPPTLFRWVDVPDPTGDCWAARPAP